MALSADVETNQEHGFEHERVVVGASHRPGEGDPHGLENSRIAGSRLPLRTRAVLLTLIGLLSLAGYVAILQASNVSRPPGAYAAYVALFAGLFALYLLACYLVLGAGSALPVKPTLLLVGVVSVAARALLVPAPPTLSNDVYRYVWDGRVMAFGVSPYKYSPNAPQLAGLHSPGYDRDLWQYINRKNAITIYPAGAEMFYAGVYGIAPDSVTVMKGAMVVVDLASCAALALLLGLLRMPPARAIVYAWSPLPIIEFGSSGHVEALSVFWTLLALITGVLAIRRYGAGLQHRFTTLTLLASVCLGAAMLIKLIPALLLVGWFRRFGWRLAVMSAVVFGVVSIIFIEAWGGYVSPFLATYIGNEESNAPLYYILKYGVASPLGIPDGAVRLLLGGALVFSALYILALRERGEYDFIGKSFLLVATYLFLATSAHAWYATWLLLFVPLFLPPNGLPLLGLAEARSRGKWTWIGSRYSIAFAALAYTGLTFLGYVVFSLSVPTLPWPMVMLQFSLVAGSFFLCVPFLNRSI
ncbi:MAG: hypothetical protein ABIQ44_12935 [Chloroflexia bacterium]